MNWTSHQFWEFLKIVGLGLTGVALLVLFGVAVGMA
jgi:hypothetical protein